MSAFSIGNYNNPPLNNVDGSLTNIDNSHIGNIQSTNTSIPNGPHTLPPPSDNVMSADGIYLKGGRRRSRRRSRRMFTRKHNRRYRRRMRSRRHRRRMRSRRMFLGGAFQPAMSIPTYPNGYSQYMNNNGSVSNVYSTGGILSASDSALANPVPVQQLPNATVPDNLNHATLNAFGNIGAGSGFVSRGSF